jgi:hypothetical protein
MALGNDISRRIYNRDRPWGYVGGDDCVWCPSKWIDTKDYVRYWTNSNKAIYQNTYIREMYGNKYPSGAFSDPKSKNLKNIPVIHFRCSDVPFVKNKCYVLPKRGVRKAILKLLKSRGYNKVYWLSNTQHKEKDCSGVACKAYSDYYKSLLKGIKIKDVSGTKEEDFMLMYNSPLVIGLIPSSFSMMAKLHDLENYRVVYNPNHVKNREIIPWSLGNIECLNHTEVLNYCDTNGVIELLNG